MLDVILPIVQTGAVGGMLIMTWRLMVKKDKKSYELIAEQNAERKEMYQSHSEIITEVVRALMDKNHTDEAMSKAVEKITEELKKLRKGLK